MHKKRKPEIVDILAESYAFEPLLHGARGEILQVGFPLLVKQELVLAQLQGIDQNRAILRVVDPDFQQVFLGHQTTSHVAEIVVAVVLKGRLIFLHTYVPEAESLSFKRIDAKLTSATLEHCW